jgi:2-amino-4-hydroxy-6-hydroxymethyldihydropteridine diphosphokinase
MRYILGVGSNLAAEGYASPLQTAVAACEQLSQAVQILSVAHWYKSPPVPVSDQPWYVNSALLIETEHQPVELLKLLQKIEVEWGRVRGVRNAARTLDLDIVAWLEPPFFFQEPEQEHQLRIPHPRMHLRSFVLFPFYDVLSSWQHPLLNKGLDELISELDEVKAAERILP